MTHPESDQPHLLVVSLYQISTRAKDTNIWDYKYDLSLFTFKNPI